MVIIKNIWDPISLIAVISDFVKIHDDPPILSKYTK